MIEKVALFLWNKGHSASSHTLTKLCIIMS